MSDNIPPQKTLIVIAGPTAVGKTAMAIEVAKHYHTDIISADSRQFYREMSIGTAKPSTEELNEVKHHFVNSHSITQNFSVGDFEKEGLAVLHELFMTSDVVVMAGGSGLYIRAICEGFDELPTVNQSIREELNAEFAKKGLSWLQESLKAVDPDYYQKVDVNNPQRIIRALEVFESTGTPYSQFRKSELITRPFNIIKIALNLPRELLYQRINQRVDVMMEQGLLEEVKALLPYRDYNALNTVGYQEFFDYFDGKTTLEIAIDKVKQNTRRFAKRQLTWFRKEKDMIWLEPDKEAVLKQIRQSLSENQTLPDAD